MSFRCRGAKVYIITHIHAGITVQLEAIQTCTTCCRSGGAVFLVRTQTPAPYRIVTHVYTQVTIQLIATQATPHVVDPAEHAA